jgi:hypothetical protein
MADQTTLMPNVEAEAPATAAKTRILANYVHVEHWLDKAEADLKAGKLEAAAVDIAVGVHRAVQNHSGLFWSPRAERVLTEIGKRIPDNGPAVYKRNPDVKRILHVATQTENIGGHSKMMRQWIQADNTRIHSLALTQHRDEAPSLLVDAVNKNGGKVFHINHTPGGHLVWAKELRKIARNFDLVILHVHSEDVVPNIAFADPKRFPPILFLNHGDHIFWLGSSISHQIINLREAARELSGKRRGIEPMRNDLLPTLVESITRKRTREEARKELGIPLDQVVLTSVARAPKYRTMNGVTYADLHVDALLKHPEAHLYVVGPGPMDDWAAANEKVGGRIHGIPRRPDPHIYFEAADVYVDAYPFVSSTSLMEAAGYGLPMVTIFKAPDAANIFAINHVALVDACRTARSFDHYTTILDDLISNPEKREAIGKAAQEGAAAWHRPPGWMGLLEALYARALANPPLDTEAFLKAAPPEKLNFGPPDSLHEEIFGGDYPTREVVKGYLGVLPFGERLKQWNALRQQGAWRTLKGAAPYMLPEWVKRRIKDRRA